MVQPDANTIVKALIAVARAAHALADGTEETECKSDPEDYAQLCAALDVMDDWPDPPMVAATGPRKAEYWLERAHELLPTFDPHHGKMESPASPNTP